jgi:hypothetical protein
LGLASWSLKIVLKEIERQPLSKETVDTRRIDAKGYIVLNCLIPVEEGGKEDNGKEDVFAFMAPKF